MRLAAAKGDRTKPMDAPLSPAALFNAEYDNMIRLAYTMTRAQELAEDIVQDAFVEVHRRWSSLLNPAGYLRTAVVNGCRQHLSRSTRRQTLLRENARVVASPAAQSGLYILDALATLPPRQQAAVVLAYYGDLRPSEIAEALGCRPGTAKSLVHRGLKRLREELGDDR